MSDLKFGMWNDLPEDEYCDTQVMPVHGGYLVNVYSFTAKGVAEALTFFPDPEHKTWSVQK